MALTGFLVNGICAPSASQALIAFASEFPKVAGSNPDLIAFSGGTFTAPNTFNMNLLTHNLNGSQTTNLTHSIILVSCDPVISPLGGTVFDPVVGAAFWSFAMTFIFGVFLISRNAQAIISAIKRF